MISSARSPDDLLDLGPLLGGSPLRELRPGQRVPRGSIALCVDREGVIPNIDSQAFDVMLTTAEVPPAPWIGVPAARLERQLATLRQRISANPIAASILCRVLRTGATIPFSDALELESLAYSTLLGGEEFTRWKALKSGMKSAEAGQVRYARERDCVTLTLDAVGSHNAMTRIMRDALYEALANVLEDPTNPTVILEGAGRCFSTGGDLAEFGTAHDLAAAHVIRTERSCARLLRRLGERATVRIHGACIGSGIEIAAAAHWREGASNTFMQLPELAMGLIPGAGGTVTPPRVIGRQRTAWLALGGFRISATTARSWGLLNVTAQ